MSYLSESNFWDYQGAYQGFDPFVDFYCEEPHTEHFGVMDSAKSAVKKTSDMIKTYPLRAVGVGIAAGMLLGGVISHYVDENNARVGFARKAHAKSKRKGGRRVKRHRK